MDFDEAKENIQPLAQGRNASILHASLNIESSQELLAQRKELEKEIHNYIGDDPLSVWYNYIEWIEQSFPSGGKESGLQEVLSKCLSKFGSDERYIQDRRMIKLYIKFIDNHKDPAECYQQLFNAGIGTMVADFYIAWAYCYDLMGNARKADEVFRRGIACRAQPIKELQEAHHHFGFSVAQRLIYKDDDVVKEETNRQLNERRIALTSLIGHRRKQIIGSIRTGSAIKSMVPGTIKFDQPSTSSQSGGVRIQVFRDENDSPNAITSTSLNNMKPLISEEGKSVVHSIIDSARNQENEKEPGPWNKVHSYKKGKLFGKSTLNNGLGFEIHEDDNSAVVIDDDLRKPCFPPIHIAESDIKFNKPFIYPPMFSSKSKPIKGFDTPVTTEEIPDRNAIPQYNKCKLYPRPNVEFQPEELKAYCIFKKRGIENKFTKEHDIYWGCGPDYNVRLYPHFAKKSNPQKDDVIVELYVPENLPGLKVAFNEIYNKEDKIERQFEEILALRIKRNETIIKTTDMDETMCINSEKIQRRKSFFPLRKSLASSGFKSSNKMPLMAKQCEAEEICGDRNLLETVSISKLYNLTSVSSSIPTIGNSNVNAAISETLKIGTLSSISENTHEAPTFISQTKMENKGNNGNYTLSNQCPEVILQKQIPSECFEIFTDESDLKVKSSMLAGNDFQFKTPALPTNNASYTNCNKLQFEIFEDENTRINSPNSNPKQDLSCGNAAFFDPEETCSTQTFNIFLRAQSVSTPKAVTKLQSQRQLGNTLKEVTTIIQEQQGDQQSIETGDQNSAATAAAIYSPPRQQLSTILEMSEHGTSQGTHTTGATTKSTLSSPEFELEPQIQSITSATANVQIQQVLETVKELSCENSSITSPTRSDSQLVNSMKIQNLTDVDTSKKLEVNFATPGETRFQKKLGACGLNFSIFEDNSEESQKHVGNFSRLEEKEDTETGSVFKTLPPIRFQDDKTETIPKMLVASHQSKFQDDKTETISKLLFVPPVSIQVQDDKTETISKMLLNPPSPIKFPEDETETISKFMLAPQHSIKFKDENTEIMLENGKIVQREAMNQYDSFEFFGHTPPKAPKQLIAKPNEWRDHSCQIRTTTDAHNSLILDSKRFCANDTLDIKKSQSNILFANDNGQSRMKSLIKEAVNNQKSNCKDNSDVFIPGFSTVECNETPQKQSKTKEQTNNKSAFRNSFIPDFSLIENSQPETNQISLENNLRPINHFKADLSLINTQLKSTRSTQESPRSRPLLSEFPHVHETQTNESIIKSSQQIESRILKEDSKSVLQFQNDLSKKEMLENKGNIDIHWRKQISDTTTILKKTQSMTLKNILMDIFMTDFSDIKEPPSIPNDDVKEKTMIQTDKNSSLKSLNESEKKCSESKSSNKNTCSNMDVECSSSSKRDTKLSFLGPATLSKNSTIKEKKSHDNDKYFELNCETEMFDTNVSMIKNSTWLPNHGPVYKEQTSQLQKNSCHIKHEEILLNSSNPSSTLKIPQICSYEDTKKAKKSFNKKSLSNDDFSIGISECELIATNDKKVPSNSVDTLESAEEDDDCAKSIYYKHTPKTPTTQIHIWDDDEILKLTANNHYVHTEPELNQTRQIIENICIDPNVNPFNVDLINAFLEQHYVISYLESLSTCMLVGCIQRLKPHAKIDIKGVSFEVLKLIGEGAYGAVFCGKEINSGKLVAMKQEKPPNYWEYYICLEIQERIRIDEMLPSYMCVDHALIGNNSSVLISSFSQYGSLITVCNKIKKHTMKNVNEYVVMLMASELLETMDHLHSVNIIHADIKADNFLLMNKLSYPPTERCLQLIDFGVSIDMKLFKQGQVFNFIHSDNAFNCPEMREQRPWTYQLDLYGLAGVLHVLLFGKYMDIEKNARGIWMHKTHVPRYLNKNLWNEIFKTLLNIRDCNSMPNLQDLRALLKKEIEEKEKYVIRMINEFNKALTN